MLSLENICVNKVLNVSCEDCSDIELSQMREMNYETRVSIFEEKMFCTTVAELLATRFTIINDNVPGILVELYPFSLDSLNFIPLCEDIKTVLNNNEDYRYGISFINNMYGNDGSIIRIKMEMLIICIIIHVKVLTLYIKLYGKFPQGIQILKNKLLNVNFNSFPDFKIKVLNCIKKLE